MLPRNDDYPGSPLWRGRQNPDLDREVSPLSLSPVDPVYRRHSSLAACAALNPELVGAIGEKVLVLLTALSYWESCRVEHESGYLMLSAF